MLYVLHDLLAVLDNVAPFAFHEAVKAVLFFVTAYHVVLFKLLVIVTFPVDDEYALLFVVAPAVVLYPIIVYPSLVIVGASTVHEVACAAPLYTAAKSHVLLAVLDSVAPFAFHFAVSVTLAFVVWAYHVLLFKELVNVNLPVEVEYALLFALLEADVLNPKIVGVFAGAVIVGASTVHEVAWAAPLKVAAKSHVLLAVLDKVALFAFHVAVKAV